MCSIDVELNTAIRIISGTVNETNILIAGLMYYYAISSMPKIVSVKK